MADLEEMRERADRRITDCDTRNLFIGILDILIEQEQAASPADTSAELAKARERIASLERLFDSQRQEVNMQHTEHLKLQASYRALRAELEAANARIAELEAELARLRAVVAKLGDVEMVVPVEWVANGIYADLKAVDETHIAGTFNRPNHKTVREAQLGVIRLRDGAGEPAS